MSQRALAERSDSDSAALLAALGSKYSAEILCAAGTPKSARTLSDDIGIPIATCYRRIEDLVDVGLLVCEGRRLSEEGRRTNIYRRAVDALEVEFTGSEPDFARKRRTEAKNRLEDRRRA